LTTEQAMYQCYSINRARNWASLLHPPQSKHARALQGLLGYKEWRNFDGAIKRAMTSCDTNGQIVSDHFVEVNKQITAGMLWYT
jgi:hypothetical protein